MSLNELIAMGTQAPKWGLMESKRKAADTALAEQQLQDYPEERNVLRKVRDLQLKKSEIDLQDAEHQRTLQPMRDEKEALGYLRDVGPMITFKNYGKSRDWLISKNNINPSILPDPNEFMQMAEQNQIPPEQVFENWKRESLLTVEQQLKQQSAEFKSDTELLKEQFKFERSAALQNLKQRYDLDLQAQKKQDALDLENVKNKNRQATGEEKDITSKQREARISVFKLYGMSEFANVDELTGEKAGAAIERASSMLSEFPLMDPQKAANRAKIYVDGQYTRLERIPIRKEPGVFSKGNSETAKEAIKDALTSGVDTAVILEAMTSKGWTKEAAIADIQTAAGVR